MSVTFDSEKPWLVILLVCINKIFLHFNVIMVFRERKFDPPLVSRSIPILIGYLKTLKVFEARFWTLFGSKKFECETDVKTTNSLKTFTKIIPIVSVDETTLQKTNEATHRTKTRKTIPCDSRHSMNVEAHLHEFENSMHKGECCPDTRVGRMRRVSWARRSAIPKSRVSHNFNNVMSHVSHKNVLAQLFNVLCLLLIFWGSTVAAKCDFTQTSAECVHMSGNFLSSFEFTSLRAMYIVDSDLSALTLEDFQFHNLCTLHLCNCSGIPPGLLTSMTHLHELRVTHTSSINESTQLEGGGDEMSTLTLYACGLKEVPSKFLVSLKNLELLELGLNEISSVQEGGFNNLESLQTLVLSMNKFESIEKGTFAPLKQLRRLDLSYNKISVIRKGAFVNMKELETMDLSHNSISAVEWGALDDGVMRLQVLDMSWNKLGTNFNYTYLPKEDGSCTVCCHKTDSIWRDNKTACTIATSPAALWQTFANLDDNPRLGSLVLLNNNPVCDALEQIPQSSKENIEIDEKEGTHEGIVECASQDASQCASLAHERLRLFLLEACAESKMTRTTIPHFSGSRDAEITTKTIVEQLPARDSLRNGDPGFASSITPVKKQPVKAAVGGSVVVVIGIIVVLSAWEYLKRRQKSSSREQKQGTNDTGTHLLDIEVN